MENIIIALEHIKNQLPVNFTHKSRDRIAMALQDFLSQLKEAGMQVTAGMPQQETIELIDEYIQLCRKSTSWRIARMHFIRASALLAAAIDHATTVIKSSSHQ